MTRMTLIGGLGVGMAHAIASATMLETDRYQHTPFGKPDDRHQIELVRVIDPDVESCYIRYHGITPLPLWENSWGNFKERVYVTNKPYIHAPAVEVMHSAGLALDSDLVVIASPDQTHELYLNWMVMEVTNKRAAMGYAPPMVILEKPSALTGDSLAIKAYLQSLWANALNVPRKNPLVTIGYEWVFHRKLREVLVDRSVTKIVFFHDNPHPNSDAASDLLGHCISMLLAQRLYEALKYGSHSDSPMRAIDAINDDISGFDLFESPTDGPLRRFVLRVFSYPDVEFFVGYSDRAGVASQLGVSEESINADAEVLIFHTSGLGFEQLEWEADLFRLQLQNTVNAQSGLLGKMDERHTELNRALITVQVATELMLCDLKTLKG